MREASPVEDHRQGGGADLFVPVKYLFEERNSSFSRNTDTEIPIFTVAAASLSASSQLFFSLRFIGVMEVCETRAQLK